MRFPRYLLLFTACSSFLALSSSAAEPTPDEIEEAARLAKVRSEWEKSGRPGRDHPVTEALLNIVTALDRPEVADVVLARGNPDAIRIPTPRGGKRVTLREFHRFQGVVAHLTDEMLNGAWVARRITSDRIEVWTATHGWLFDGKGGLVAEANVFRQGGTGREWHGAFLPDGQWITTQISENDSTLSFFTSKGTLSRISKCTVLAARTPDAGVDLIGWARSDKDGRGWVVNVGSEGGYATVWVGLDGVSHVLKGIERWQRCHPRALGPRGTVWSMEVPDDRGLRSLNRGEPGHGKWVGYPGFSVNPVDNPGREDDSEPSRGITLGCVAGGDHVFGFWPGGRGMFVGAERYGEVQDDKLKTRKWVYSQLVTSTGTKWERSAPIYDRTWFFNPEAKCIGWIAGRRIGDAADGKAMLFRLAADSRIAVLKPDLSIAAMKRMHWNDGSVADAVALWDDLRCGLFVRDRKLILAAW